MRALCCAAVALACLALSTSPRSEGADDPAKKWLVGRWAPVSEKAPDSADAKAPESKSKPKSKPKTSAKKPAASKAPEELPKCVIEFTKDGAIRLDGEVSALGSNFRFAKPLADVAIRVSPETRNIKINYEFKDAKSIDVSADHSWLLEKLSAGGSIPPEKAKQLNEEYRPRETINVSADAKTLTLTNASGQSSTFRRYTGGSLMEEEGRRREADLRNGLSPFTDILKQQGINTGAPPKEKAAKKK
jgi:hypothetical protein